MKINIKTATLMSFLLGTIFYFLSNKKTINTQPISIEKPSRTIVDKKLTHLAAPKPLVLQSVQNGLGIDNNWKSK